MRSSHLLFTEAWGDEDDVSFTAGTLGVMVASSVVGLMTRHFHKTNEFASGPSHHVYVTDEDVVPGVGGGTTSQSPRIAGASLL